MTLPNPVQRAAEERAARIASGDEWSPRRFSPVPPGVTFTPDRRIESARHADRVFWASAALAFVALLCICWALVEFWPIVATIK